MAMAAGTDHEVDVLGDIAGCSLMSRVAFGQQSPR
jgi:hypothetical protein